jgi:hypothetical protein
MMTHYDVLKFEFFFERSRHAKKSKAKEDQGDKSGSEEANK